MGKGAKAFGIVFLFLVLQCALYLMQSGKRLEIPTQNEPTQTTSKTAAHIVGEESLIASVKEEDERSAVARLGEIPRIDQIVHGKKNIVGNPQSLFHFAVVGFAKCGTTALLQWLWEHPETCIPKKELIFMRRHPAKQIKEMHALATSPKCGNGTKVNGYKNPHDIQYATILRFLRNKLPETKLVVTIRHPVRFFESFYVSEYLLHLLHYCPVR